MKKLVEKMQKELIKIENDCDKFFSDYNGSCTEENDFHCHEKWYKYKKASDARDIVTNALNLLKDLN
jgi:hypothetical protein